MWLSDFKMLSVWSLEFLGVFSVGFAVLAWKLEFASAFGAFGHAALNHGGAASAGEGSAVAYVEGEAASGAMYNALCLRHCITLSSF
mgnify:CR=1 FL=1